jgi:hypothetical protein
MLAVMHSSTGANLDNGTLELTRPRRHAHLAPQPIIRKRITATPADRHHPTMPAARTSAVAPLPGRRPCSSGSLEPWRPISPESPGGRARGAASRVAARTAWAASDDVQRGELIESAPTEVLTQQVDAVGPLSSRQSIALWMTRETHSAPFYGDLTQAAMEAQFEVDRRA